MGTRDELSLFRRIGKVFNYVLGLILSFNKYVSLVLTLAYGFILVS